MKTHYVIAYRGTNSYVYSVNHSTGEALYTSSILEARLFDSMIEATLVIFGLLDDKAHFTVAVTR